MNLDSIQPDSKQHQPTRTPHHYFSSRKKKEKEEVRPADTTPSKTLLSVAASGGSGRRHIHPSPPQASPRAVRKRHPASNHKPAEEEGPASSASIHHLHKQQETK
jgi:hypothetical protein